MCFLYGPVHTDFDAGKSITSNRFARIKIIMYGALLTINAPAIMKVFYFFYAGKTLYWVVRGVFQGDRDLFDL